jgi:deoxyribonuclease-4
MEPLTMRVRQVLARLDATQRAQLKKLLPPTAPAAPPDELVAATQSYPSAVLSCFPPPQAYSLLGIVAEHLLCLPPSEDPGLAELAGAVRLCNPAALPATLAKLETSKTVPPFLEAIRETRAALNTALEGALGRAGQVVRHGKVVGHPDMRTRTKMIEMKLTGQLKQNWLDFLFQVAAYGALAPEVTDLYLVLPLQRAVWRADIRSWATRTAYRDALCAAAEKVIGFHQSGGALTAALLLEEHLVGYHAPKQRSLPDTVRALPDSRRPYQIFLGAPHTSKMSIADAELAAAAAVVQERGVRVYIHSQYLINLSNPATTDRWHVELLRKNLQAAVAMGARGVVVHVGKAVKSEPAAATAAMRAAIAELLPAATAECPLLLETPAGQGTELLTVAADFLDFVGNFADNRLRACVDTCHVFACGHNPLEYITALTARDPTLLKLVHYNDSAAPCGSCVDRHAHVGQGHIGLGSMQAIAELCTARGLPMVVE